MRPAIWSYTIRLVRVVISLISLMIGATNAIDIHLSGEGGFVDCNGANTIFGEDTIHAAKPTAPFLDIAHVVEGLGENVIANL